MSGVRHFQGATGSFSLIQHPVARKKGFLLGVLAFEGMGGRVSCDKNRSKGFFSALSFSSFKINLEGLNNYNIIFGVLFVTVVHWAPKPYFKLSKAPILITGSGLRALNFGFKGPRGCFTRATALRPGHPLHLFWSGNGAGWVHDCRRYRFPTDRKGATVSYYSRHIKPSTLREVEGIILEYQYNHALKVNHHGNPGISQP